MDRIITESNFHSLSEILEEVKKRANENKCGSAIDRFYFVGTELFERFCKGQGLNITPAWWWGKENSLTNKSSIAEVVTVYYTDYYYDSQSDRQSWDRASKFLGVRINGEILRASFYKSNAADFSFLADMRDYYHKMPYKWEENNPSPNKASLLTDKKIQAWYDWLCIRRKVYDDLKNEQDDNIKKFLERVRSVKNCDAHIGDTSGRITKNNIRYSYKIDNGTIWEEIAIDKPYGDDKLSTFLLMIDGKYDKKQ